MLCLYLHAAPARYKSVVSSALAISSKVQASSLPITYIETQFLYPWRVCQILILVGIYTFQIMFLTYFAEKYILYTTLYYRYRLLPVFLLFSSPECHPTKIIIRYLIKYISTQTSINYKLPFYLQIQDFLWAFYYVVGAGCFEFFSAAVAVEDSYGLEAAGFATFYVVASVAYHHNLV